MTPAEDFWRDGHAFVRGLASRAEIDAYRPIIERVVAANAGHAQGRIDDYSSLFTQVTNIWRLSEDARRIVFEPRFSRSAAELLGVAGVRLYHDQALFKPPGAGRTPWHQDRYYWPLDTDFTVTMWLALVDLDEEMGLMRFASGSHRAEGGYRPISDADVGETRWPLWSAPPMCAGDATFHAGGTLHSAVRIGPRACAKSSPSSTTPPARAPRSRRTTTSASISRSFFRACSRAMKRRAS